MYEALQRLLAWSLLACLTLVAGCGGGGGGEAPATTVSGLATKGPISGATVQIHRLTPGGAAGELLGSGLSGADGRFQISIPAAAASGPLLVTVTGNAQARYLSESTGAQIPFGAGETLSAVAGDVSGLATLTVSPLTEAAYQKLQEVLTENPALGTADGITRGVAIANSRIALLSGVGNILADPAGDPVYRAALLLVDRMAEDAREADPGAGLAAAMTLINGAYADTASGSDAYRLYRQALDTAFLKLAAAPENAALISSLTLIRALAADPPAEPDLSDVTAPSRPANLSATPTALSASAAAVRLTWSAVSDLQLAGYEVFRDGVRIATVGTTGYTDAAVSFNVNYSYFVVAFDAAGNRSAASNAASATPRVPPLNVVIGGEVGSDIFDLPTIDNVRPTSPATLSAVPTATGAATSSILVSWSAAGDNVAVAGYDLFRDGVKIATVTGLSYTDPSLASNVTYRYSVTAFDAAGNRSPAGLQVSITPLLAPLGVTVSGQVNPGGAATDNVPPAAPLLLSATPSALTASSSSVRLAWSASSDNVGVAGYELFRNGVKVATVTGLSYTDPSLASGVGYSYTLRAFDAAGNRSAAGNQLSVTPPVAPLNVTIGGQVQS